MSDIRQKYGVPKLRRTSRHIPIVSDNPVVADVPGEFEHISTRADHLASQDGELFRGKRRFRYTHVNRPPLNVAKNHFQGVQRLRGGKYLAISGGDAVEAASHIFFVKMGSRRAEGPWGSNLVRSKRPNDKDDLVKTIPMDNEYWHGGGLSVLGDILAVPLEAAGKSKVAFLHVADPENPTQLNCAIERTTIPNAGAVALGKLVDQRFVCAVWREVKKKPRGRLEFYVSKTTDLRDGFQMNPDGIMKMISWNYGSLDLDEKREPAYQSINFIEPADKDAGNGVTRLYMIATENTSPGAPLIGGRNLADLYEILIPAAMFGPPRLKPTVNRLATKQFHCEPEYCNLDAGGGIYIDPTRGLSLYSVYHWRSDDTIRFSEFRAKPDPNSVISKTDDAWIEIYEDREFGGRRLSVLGRHDSNFRNYNRLFVQGKGFDNKISSVKWQLPPGQTYRLYRDKFFAGQRPGRDFLNLQGDGTIQKIPDFKQQFPRFENKISSSQYV